MGRSATMDNEYGQDLYEAMDRWDPMIHKEVNKDIGLAYELIMEAAVWNCCGDVCGCYDFVVLP